MLRIHLDDITVLSLTQRSTELRIQIFVRDIHVARHIMFEGGGLGMDMKIMRLRLTSRKHQVQAKASHCAYFAPHVHVRSLRECE